MALAANPIELTNGQSISALCRIVALVWTGPTSSGDTCEVTKLVSGDIVWRATTDSTQTYLGLAPTHYAIPCQFGVTVTCPANTSVLVYIREE